MCRILEYLITELQYDLEIIVDFRQLRHLIFGLCLRTFGFETFIYAQNYQNMAEIIQI